MESFPNCRKDALSGFSPTFMMDLKIFVSEQDSSEFVKIIYVISYSPGFSKV